MRPFKKIKEAKQEEARAGDNARYEVEQQFDAAIQKASELEDPAAKILALRIIENEIYAQIKREDTEIDKKAEKAQKIPGKLSAPLWYGGIGALLFVSGPPGWIAGGAAAAASAGSTYIGYRRKKSVTKKLELAAADHTANMEGQIDLVSTMINVTVKYNVEKISKSPLKDKVLALPGIANKFAEAAAPHVPKPEAPEAAKAAPPAANPASKKLRISKKPGQQS
jgi:hypothetical protein